MSWGGGAKYRKPLLLQLGFNHSGLLLYPRHIQRGGPLGDDLPLIRFSTLLCSKTHFPGLYLVQLTRWELERASLSTGQVTCLSYISYQPCQISVLSWCFFPLAGIGLGAIIFYPEKAHWQAMTRQVRRESITPRKFFTGISPDYGIQPYSSLAVSLSYLLGPQRKWYL